MYDPPLNIIGKIAPDEPRNEQVTRRPAGTRPLQSTRCSRAEQRGRRGRRCLFGSVVPEPASARRASILPFDARGNGAPPGYLIILLPRRLRKPSRLEALFPIAPPSRTLEFCTMSSGCRNNDAAACYARYATRDPYRSFRFREDSHADAIRVRASRACRSAPLRLRRGPLIGSNGDGVGFWRGLATF